MAIYTSASQLIGNTPLLKLENIEKKLDLKANLYAKVEYFNPTGSVKDRAALYMIEEGEKDGTINKDTVLIEPTSGNTGIGLASIATAKGYKLIIVMPSTMSVERRNIIKAYGAEIVLVDGGMPVAIKKAEELKEEYGNAIVVGQFTNPANPKAHYETTGPEIYKDLEGKVDAFIAGVGTGGTITGTGQYLKEQNPDTKVIAVEPLTSAVLSTGKAGAHKIQGIGAGFVPDILDTKVIDEIVTIDNEECFETSKLLGRTEGILVGISAGAALKAAINEASKEENAGKNIVVLLPDSGDRYYSTALFGE